MEERAGDEVEAAALVAKDLGAGEIRRHQSGVHWMRAWPRQGRREPLDGPRLAIPGGPSIST